MLRFLPFLALVALIIAASQFLPIKRYVAYKLGISGDSCCVDVATILHSNGNFDENSNTAIFDGQPVDYPKTSLAQTDRNLALSEDPNSKVLGTTTSDGREKWIEVNIAQQMLRAWEGNQVVMEFPISSGKWFPTPKGTFNIWYKTRFQRMVGGEKELGTYYNLPNVPYNMFFYQGYALHGAYWHNNFGHPMSHGCVNEPVDMAAKMFAWAGPVVPDGMNAVRATPENPGTRVYIH